MDPLNSYMGPAGSVPPAMPMAGVHSATPVIPKLYWDAYDDEQRIKLLWKCFGEIAELVNQLGYYYVPTFAGEWDATKQYPPLTVVSAPAGLEPDVVEGDSYTAIKWVPVGTPLTDTDYWALTGNYNANIAALRQAIADEATNRVNADNALQAQIDSLAGIRISSLGYSGGDGTEILNSALSNYKRVYLDVPVVCNGVVNVNSGNVLSGEKLTATSINITGSKTSTINNVNVTTNNIAASIPNNTLVQVYNETNRQTNYYSNKYIYPFAYQGTFDVETYDPVHDVVIENIEITGPLIAYYANNIVMRNVKMTSLDGATYGPLFASCTNIIVDNCTFAFGQEKRLTFALGASGCLVRNCSFEGGSSESDNAQLKLNETFYCAIQNCVFAPPNDPSGYHSIQLDGDYTEDGYPNNPGHGNSIENCTSTDLVQINKQVACSIDACAFNYVNITSSDVAATNSTFSIESFNKESNFKADNCVINDISNVGCKYILTNCIINANININKNYNGSSFVNCTFDSFTCSADNIVATNCNFGNINVTSENSNISGIANGGQISGSKNSIFNLINPAEVAVTNNDSCFIVLTGSCNVPSDTNTSMIVTMETAPSALAGNIQFHNSQPDAMDTGTVVFNSGWNGQSNSPLGWIRTTYGTSPFYGSPQS